MSKYTEAEVLELFADAQRMVPELASWVSGESDDEYAMIVHCPADDEVFLDHSMYASPWRDRLPNGRLTPEYGPSPSGFTVELALYNLRGFWDQDEHDSCAKRVQKPKRVLKRDDAARMDAFIKANKARLKPHELTTYYAFWINKLSYTHGAKKLGVAKGVFIRWITLLRQKMERAELKLAQG